MLTIISYDIPDDRRRTKLAKLLENYADRVQYSVFEGLLRAQEIDDLRRRVEKLIDADKDAVRIYRLCATCEREIRFLGQSEPTRIDDAYIL